MAEADLHAEPKCATLMPFAAAKAEYLAARQHEEQAGEAGTAAEGALFTKWKTDPEPTREITYIARGFTRGPLTMAAQETTINLTDLYRNPAYAEDIATHPDYVEWLAEHTAWQARREAAKNDAAYVEAHDQWKQACQQETAAWGRLVASEPASAAEMVEKLALCAADVRVTSTGDGDVNDMLSAMVRDVQRFVGGAAVAISSDKQAWQALGDDEPGHDPALVKFEAMDISFDYTNEDWALQHLPVVRVATLLLRDDDVALTTRMQDMAGEGIVPEMFEGIADTMTHLRAVADVLNAALTRSFVALDRLGFSPDQPPSDRTLTGEAAIAEMQP